MYTRLRPVIAIVFLVLLAACANPQAGSETATSNPKLTSTRQPTTKSRPTQMPPTGTPQGIHAIGKSVDIQQWGITVRSFHIGKDPTELDSDLQEHRAQPGNVFLIVESYMQNKGADSLEVRDAMWRLTGKDGHVYQSIKHVSFADPASVILNMPIESELIYEVPANLKTFEIAFYFQPQSKPERWPLQL